MLGRVRGRLPAVLCAGAMTMAVAAGCGDDGDSTAKEDQAEVSAARESPDTFVMRMAKLIETTTSKKDCGELDKLNVRSVIDFGCPASKELRKSMRSFEVVGAEEYGTGAIVDYKSGAAKDGAAIVMFLAPSASWGVSRFGVVTKPSTGTSDAKHRAGYAKAVEMYLSAVRERDCDAYVSVTFNGGDKKSEVCKNVFPGTKKLTQFLERNPDAKPRYEGGNAAYGFSSLEITKPKSQSFTISIARATAESPQPYVVLDVTQSPTAAQQKAVRASKQAQDSDQPETSPSRKVEGDPNTLTN